VARGAPEELQSLNNETGVLALAIDLLVEEIKDENSTLMRAGESRKKQTLP
jgi:hypothetical protein